MRNGPRAPADTIPTVGPLAPLLKYPQTFDPRCPLLHRGQNVPNFDPSRLQTAVFLNRGTLSENKNNLVKDQCRSTIIPNLGWVGPPNSQNRWRNGYPKEKKWKISYISSIPPAQAEYSATNVIPPVGAVAAAKRLRCQISQFTPYSSQGVTQKHKSDKFLIYPPFQWLTPSTLPPMLYHLLGP